MSSVEKRIRGGRIRWYARWIDPDDRPRSKVFDRQQDAKDHLTTVESSKLTDTYIDPRAGAISVQAYFDEWSQRQVWTAGTMRAMSLAVRSTTFSKVKLSRLRTSHLEAWVKSMSNDGLAPGTIRTRFNNVRAMLRAAKRDRLIASDPAEGVRLPRGRAREAAMTIPTPEQVGALLGAADDLFRAFVALCAFAGLRLGEAAAMQVGDVDFLRRALHVRRQVQRAGGSKVEIRAPKYGSERTVYVPDNLLTILARHIEVRGIGNDPGAWLFEGAGGLPPHQNSVGYWWRKTRMVAKLTTMRLHDARHFFASGLIAAGCDVVTVQRAMGHKSASTTLSTYAHLWPTAEDRTRAAAAEMMSSALAGMYPLCTGEVSDAT